MSFEAPAALWLALILPVILALWVLRPRRVRHRVSSLFLWQSSLIERRSAQPWQRLRNDPLLWLQLLVALLLIAAAVRPFLPAGIEAKHTVILLDASGSMRATDRSPTRFAAASEQVRRAARTLGPDRQVTAIRVSERPDVLATAAPGRTAAIEHALALAEPGFGVADLAAAFALAEGVAPDATEWLLVSDGGLEAPAGTQLPERVTLRQYLIAPIPAAGNVALTGFRLRVDAGRASVQASVRNFGAEPAAGRLVLLAEAEVAGARDWTLEPGAETQITWSQLPAATRWLEARLADVPATANALTHDDRAWVAMPSQHDRRVLLVSDGNSFLERVLAVLSDVRADRVAKSGWTSVAASGNYDVLVFDGLWPATPVPGNMLVVGAPGSESFAPGRIQSDAAHPLVRHVDWSDVNIASAARLPESSGWTPVVRSAAQPLLAVREQGRQRAAALTFRLDNSDLPLRPAFPVLIANLLDWLAPRSSGAALAVYAGDAVRIEPAPLADTIFVQHAGGAVDTLAPPWPPNVFRPPVPGLYSLIEKGPSLRHERLIVASAYAASEADLSARTLVIDGAGVERGRNIRLAAWSLWPLLAALVIAFALAEWWVDARGR